MGRMAVGKPLKGHFSSVSSVTYSPDGQLIISGSYNKNIRRWDPKAVFNLVSLDDPRRTAAVRRCPLFQGAVPHHLWIFRQENSNMGHGDWISSRQASRGVHWLGVICTLPTLLMAATSSPDRVTRPSEYGMRRLALQLASLSRGTLTGCHLLLTRPMGAISSPDPMTCSTIRVWDAGTCALFVS